MTHRHALFVVCLAVALLVSPTILAQETATATRNTTDGGNDTAGMGAQLTAFTQSNAAAASDSVENGMWRAGFDQSNASEQARLVRDRAGTLERRLDRLQRENETLRRQYENGSVTEPAYIARQSRLSARIDALQTAVNDTGEAAQRAGVNDSRLEQLRESARNFTGPEVAAVARGLGGGPPENRGPPEDRGPSGERGQPADRADGESPGDRGPSGERGQPADRGQSANRGGGADAGADDSEDRGPPGNRGGGATDRTDSTNGAAGGAQSG